jgi:hypothetical protein
VPIGHNISDIVCGADSPSRYEHPCSAVCCVLLCCLPCTVYCILCAVYCAEWDADLCMGAVWRSAILLLLCAAVLCSAAQRAAVLCALCPAVSQLSFIAHCNSPLNL